MKLLNVGCGRHYHPDWVNLDLEAHSEKVIEHDLHRGLPFEDGVFDGVYHSHVLEHFAQEDGRRLIDECCRVLKPGGIVRVVVPDLEGIARSYLRTLEAADQDQRRWPDHLWMTVELIDQLARTESGGRMSQLIRDSSQVDSSFPISRIGRIYSEVARPPARPRRDFPKRIYREFRRWRQAAALAAMTLIQGHAGRRAYREGAFRQSGEVHRWMYDRLSLARLLQDAGFCEVVRREADTSGIPEFARFQLDAAAGHVRKPDSLFMEGCKKAPSVCRAA